MKQFDPKRLQALNDSYKHREYSDAYDPIKKAANRIPDLQATSDRLAGSNAPSTFAASRTAMLSTREEMKQFFKDLPKQRRKGPHPRKLSDQVASEIKTALNAGTPSKDIAQKYDVSQTTISFINNGSAYPEIEPLTRKQQRAIKHAD